jgi:hypothetical protein
MEVKGMARLRITRLVETSIRGLDHPLTPPESNQAVEINTETVTANSTEVNSDTTDKNCDHANSKKRGHGLVKERRSRNKKRMVKVPMIQ